MYNLILLEEAMAKKAAAEELLEEAKLLKLAAQRESGFLRYTEYPLIGAALGAPIGMLSIYGKHSARHWPAPSRKLLLHYALLGSLVGAISGFGVAMGRSLRKKLQGG